MRIIGHIFAFIFLASCTKTTSDMDIMIERFNYEEKRQFTEVLIGLNSVLSEEYPDIYQSLNRPASQDELAKLESIIGFNLPEDFKTLYFEFNGQNNLQNPMFEYGYALMEIDVIISNWKVMKELYDSDTESRTVYGISGKIMETWWQPAWVPIAELGNGDFICIDMSPGKLGTQGQIIEFINDDSERNFLGKSLKDYVGQLESNLSSGKLSLDQDATFTFSENES